MKPPKPTKEDLERVHQAFARWGAYPMQVESSKSKEKDGVHYAAIPYMSNPQTRLVKYKYMRLPSEDAVWTPCIWRDGTWGFIRVCGPEIKPFIETSIPDVFLKAFEGQ